MQNLYLGYVGTDYKGYLKSSFLKNSIYFLLLCRFFNCVTMVMGEVVAFFLLIVAIHFSYFNVYILMLVNLTPCFLLVMHIKKGSKEKYKTEKVKNLSICEKKKHC